jgi:hypothetical protein
MVAISSHRFKWSSGHYVPVLVSRLKQASEKLAGRFDGWQASDSETPNTEPDGAGAGVAIVH